jgi:hypothetical protein
MVSAWEDEDDDFEEADAPMPKPWSIIDRTKQVLKKLGLLTAIESFPALLAVVIACVAALHFIGVEFGRRPFYDPYLMLASVILGTLLGLFVYVVGGLWDDWIFDPRYSWRKHPEKKGKVLEGRWLKERDPPYKVFPAGLPLRKAKRACTNVLKGPRKPTTGIYKKAKEHLQIRKKWKGYVVGSLVLSKFVRSFIWPFLLAASVCVVLAVIATGGGLAEGPTPITWGLIGLACVTVGVLLFLPCIYFRVEHMRSLYETATELKKGEKA